MCLEILGIEIDTREMILHLPARKTDTISRIVDAWCGRRSGKKGRGTIPCWTSVPCMSSGKTRKVFPARDVYGNKPRKKGNDGRHSFTNGMEYP